MFAWLPTAVTIDLSVLPTAWAINATLLLHISVFALSLITLANKSCTIWLTTNGFSLY